MGQTDSQQIIEAERVVKFRQPAHIGHPNALGHKEVDSGRPKSVPGVVAVTLPDGSTTELTAFKDGAELVLVFADGTTGAEWYAPGRFLRIPASDGDADVIVDFNHAFIPPCGFSDFYSCPLPPPENRMTIPVRAGERRAMWNGGPRGRGGSSAH